MTLIFELVAIILTISVCIKFELHLKFVSRILRHVVIYLPPTDANFEMILEMKKGKVVNPQGNTLIRSCGVLEYLTKVKDENTSDIDLTVLFFMTSLVNITFQLITNCVHFYWVGTAEEDAQSPNINVISSFTFITILYILFVALKHTFKTGYKSYEARLFYLIFLVSGIAMFICLNYFPVLFNLNNDSICETVNSRLQLIITYANSLSESKFILCNKLVSNIFFSFVFAVSLGLVYRSSIRLSTFDNILYDASQVTDNTENSQEKKPYKEKLINNIIKVKLILVSFLFLLFIDPLLKKPLIENKIISENVFYLLVLIPLIFIEFCLNYTAIKYYSILFLNQNYKLMVEFCHTPDKIKLQYVRVTMTDTINTFWEIFLQLFNIVFLNLITYIFMLHRSNLFTVINAEDKQDTKPKSNFIETMIFFILFALICAKTIFGNINLYYLKNIYTNKRVMVI